MDGPDTEPSIEPTGQGSDTDDRTATDWTEAVTHYGWLAKGFLFVVIGVLALRLATQGYSSDRADQTGALRLLADGPLGQVLLFATSVGLLMFALWQLGQAIVSDATNPLGLAKRIGWLGLGATYAFLAVTGFQIATASSPAEREQRSSGGESGPTSPEGLTMWLFGIPGGRVIVGLIAIGTLGVAAYHLRKGVQQEFLDDIETDDLDDQTRAALAVAGTAGFAARALVLGLVGSLFIVATWQFDPDEAAGLDQVLRTIAEAPWGRAVLALCAVGLMSAGLYDMTTWRRQRLD